MIGIQEEFFPTHGLTAFGVHPSGCLPPVNTLKRGHQTRLEPVSPAAFHHAVALARLILHDLESAAQARMARSGLENALRRLNNTQTEATRLRGELRHRLPDLPESTVQPGLGSHAQKLVEAMLDYVHQHGHRPISLYELASAMKMNASYHRAPRAIWSRSRVAIRACLRPRFGHRACDRPVVHHNRMGN